MKNSNKICPKCNTSNPEEANFCRHCGYEFQAVQDAKNENENSLIVALQKKIIALQNEIKERHSIRTNKLKCSGK